VVDIILEFRTTYYNEENELIVDKRTIAARYMRFWFPVDVAATIPFELVGCPRLTLLRPDPHADQTCGQWGQ
jgi:hypothetical protein